VTNANGARNSDRYSIAKRLKIRAFDKGNQIIPSRHRMDLLNNGAVKLHIRQFLDQILDACWFSLN